MEILYHDCDLVVCIKPPRVLSTDEPGGLPELLRAALGTRDFRTVHRLDRVVSGLMVLARSPQAAAALSSQIREGTFEKEYLAVVHGRPARDEDTLRDFLARDKARKMTVVVPEASRDARPAVLHYRVLHTDGDRTRVRIQLETGRTHQIRVQFASRGMPLLGERKYRVGEDACELALWSYRLAFVHPTTGEYMEFTQEPPKQYPWTEI